jgi:cell division protein FtsZ
VVATGIDQAFAHQQAIPAAEQRIAEIAQRLRADNQRATERNVEPVRPVAAAVAPVAPAAPPIATAASVASAAKAAIAAAILPHGHGDEVTIRPLPPKPSLFIDPAMSAPEPQDPESFIPPEPERPVARAPRMPRIDELPVPAQNEIRARRGELVQDDHPEKQRMTLLQRLAAVGLGRRQQDDQQADPGPRSPAPLAQPSSRLAGRPMARLPEPRPEPVSEYARRPAPQGLDQHGRQAPVHNSPEEDQLDIPAFLRRQAN